MKFSKPMIGILKLPPILVNAMGWMIYLSDYWLITMDPKYETWVGPPDLPMCHGTLSENFSDTTRLASGS